MLGTHRPKNKKMNRDLKYLLILLAVAAFFLGFQYFKHAGIRAYQHVRRSSLSLDSLPNGRYSGSFRPFNLLPLAKVSFRVDGGQVKDFSIPRLVDAPWNQVKHSITDTIRTKQSVHFDAITGATRSSYFVKAAVHDAAGQAGQNKK